MHYADKIANPYLIEWVEKEKEKERRLYETIEKCEDEIAHYTSLLDALNEKRDCLLEELDNVRSRIKLVEFNPKYDVRSGEEPEDLQGLKGKAHAEKFMEMYTDSFGRDRKKVDTEKENEKLQKRESSLNDKLLSVRSRIFAAEQKIKKAKSRKYDAEYKLGI